MNIDLDDAFNGADKTIAERVQAASRQFVLSRRRHWSIPGKDIFFDRKPVAVGLIDASKIDKITFIAALQNLIHEDATFTQDRIAEKGRDPYLIKYDVELKGLEDAVSISIPVRRLHKDMVSRYSLMKKIEDICLGEEVVFEDEELADDEPQFGMVNYLWHVWNNDDTEEMDVDLNALPVLQF